MGLITVCDQCIHKVMWYDIVEWMFAVYKSLVFYKEEQNIHRLS